MPWFFLASAIGGLVYYYKGKKDGALDTSLSPVKVAAIRYALRFETDPVPLEDFSQQCALNNLPLAAAALHKRAIELKASK